MEVLNLQIGPMCYNFCMEADANRIRTAERAMSEASKEARRSLKSLRKDVDEVNINLEGQLYGAGIAE